MISLEAHVTEQKRSRWVRFLDSFSGNPWEDFLDLIRTHHLIRRVFFGALVVVFWGNWNMVGAIVAIWAIYEALAVLKRLFWN